MAQRVAEMDVRMAAAMARGPENVAAYCRSVGISRRTFYKWRHRFLAEGVPGLEDRPRTPRSRPGATSGDVEDAIVRCRKRLRDSGKDFGPQSVRWTLESLGVIDRLPSRATIARILLRRGLVTPQPRKRPKSSMRRFTFPRPNSCWQSDATEWQLADGSTVGIAGTLDDHSRLLVGLRACPGEATGALVWRVFTDGISGYGIPSMSLSDNGSIYTARHHGGEADFERNLRALGVQVINSRPRHPQTCGKIERFWQTLKRWLAAQPRAGSVEELNEQLEVFGRYYNTERRHRALPGMCTPAQAFAATAPARPADRPLPTPVLISARTVDAAGRVSVGRYLVALGRRWGGHTAHVITDGDHITVFSGSRLIRALDADPTRRAQPLPGKQPYRDSREPRPADMPQAASANASRRRQ
jgi:transposase InsO family protein